MDIDQILLINRSQEKMIYFITGASGVGKTTLVSQLKKKYEEKPWVFLHFDSIGIPSRLEMEREFGSGSEWQKAAAFKWIDKIIHQYNDEKVLIEGQVNLEFIRSGFAEHNFNTYKIILIHCDEEKMSVRLTHNRGQPELFDQSMRNWLGFLKNQAEETETAIIDTSNLSDEEALTKFEEVIGL